MPGSVYKLPPLSSFIDTIKKPVAEFTSDNSDEVMRFVLKKEKEEREWKVIFYGKEITYKEELRRMVHLERVGWKDWTYGFLSKTDERRKETKSMTAEKRFLQYVKWAEEMMEFSKKKKITDPYGGITGSFHPAQDIQRFLSYYYRKYKEDRVEFMEEIDEDVIHDMRKYYDIIDVNYDKWKDWKSRRETPPEDVRPAKLSVEEKPKPKPEPERITETFQGTVKTLDEIEKIKSKISKELYLFEEHDEFSIELGVNSRGDVIDVDYNYKGHYDSKTKKFTRKTSPPEDWEGILTIIKSMNV